MYILTNLKNILLLIYNACKWRGLINFVGKSGLL